MSFITFLTAKFQFLIGTLKTTGGIGKSIVDGGFNSL